MPDEFEIIVLNRLVAEKRDLNLYHQANRSAYIISPGSSTKILLKSVEEKDYLHLSVVKGPGDLHRDCFISVPSWADFELNSYGSLNCSRRHEQEGERTVLKIPPGPPSWELKITKPAKAVLNGRAVKKEKCVVISDNSSAIYEVSAP